MVLRQRTISMGYFDYQICRFVKPLTLEAAARNLDIRHMMITGEDQHVEKKTLDDYYGYIRVGKDPRSLFEFSENKDGLIKQLRTHCIKVKQAQNMQSSSSNIIKAKDDSSDEDL